MAKKSKKCKRAARVMAYKALRLILEHKNVKELGFLGTDVYDQLCAATATMGVYYPGVVKAARMGKEVTT